MEPQDVIALFDSCWFEQELFNKKSLISISGQNPCHQIQEKHLEPKISTSPSILTRSKSDQLSSFSSFNSDVMFSPNSVLYPRQLHTIPSAKEIKEEKEEETITTVQEHFQEKVAQKTGKNRGSRKSRRSKKKGTLNKSLSELEFKELKGFMDLGFVFSDKDLDTNLVEIIPGLQRLNKKSNGDDQEKVNTVVESSPSVSRPYLSEAWEVLERQKRLNEPLMKWRIGDLSNEVGIKDSLKWWAHSVASTVR